MNHAQKLKRIETLMASPDVIELESLSAEVEAFEKEAYPIPLPTIPEAMLFRRIYGGFSRERKYNYHL